MKPDNPFESPETRSPQTPGRSTIYHYGVMVFWVMIPFGPVVANLFLKPYYETVGIDVPVITTYLFSWLNLPWLALPAVVVIVAMYRMRPGILRFSVAAFAVLLGLLVVLICTLGYLMPAISVWKGLTRM